MGSQIQTAIEAVNDALESGVPNLVKAYDYPVDQLYDERCVMTYYGGGDLQTQSSAWELGLHNIVCDFIVFRKDLARDMQLLMTDVDEIYAALVADVTFGGAISTFERVTCGEPIANEWGGVPIFILRFTLENVKIIT